MLLRCLSLPLTVLLNLFVANQPHGIHGIHVFVLPMLETVVEDFNPHATWKMASILVICQFGFEQQSDVMLSVPHQTSTANIYCNLRPSCCRFFSLQSVKVVTKTELYYEVEQLPPWWHVGLLRRLCVQRPSAL